MSSPRSSFLVLAELAGSPLRPSCLVLEDWVPSCCLSWEYIVGFWWMFRVSILSVDETQLWSNCWFTGLFGSLESWGGFFFALRRFLDTKFIGLGFATAEPSSEILSWHDTLLAERNHRKNHDIQQTKEMVPLITCEASFGKHVCDWVSGVKIFDLDLWVQVDSVESPIKSNSVGFCP